MLLKMKNVKKNFVFRSPWIFNTLDVFICIL